MIKKVYNQERIIKIISENPGISSTKIADKMKLNRVTIFLYLRELQEIEKIRIDGKGKATRYFLHNTAITASHLKNSQKLQWNETQVQVWKQEIQFSLMESYDENVDINSIEYEFEENCMYIDGDMVIRTGFDAFVAWCTDPVHNFSDRIVAKAGQYLEILASIKIRRKKHGFLDATELVKQTLGRDMISVFDNFLFLSPSRLDDGFGATRTAIELRYGKINNRFLLEAAIEKLIDPAIQYIKNTSVDAYLIAPPTVNREIQFRDILKKRLNLEITYIESEKIPTLGMGIIPQKEIQWRGKKSERIKNAMRSIDIKIPKEIHTKGHIVIFDDTFTTGATPNALAIKLRDVWYVGRITIITVCGSFVFDDSSFNEEI